MSFYSLSELHALGIRTEGSDVFVSRKCSLYTNSLVVGNHVRIDDFCILSGDITIGSYVHISAYSALYGKGGIQIGNFCGVSPRSTLLSASDDFSGEHMISPMVPAELCGITASPIVMENFCQFGANTTVLPGVTAHEGAVTGACSLVLSDLEEWSIYFGIPCRRVKARNRNAKEMAIHALNWR